MWRIAIVAMTQKAGRLSEYRLEPWGEGDEPLLQRLLGDPVDDRAPVRAREPGEDREAAQAISGLPGTGTGEMFKVVDATGESVGSIGYWERESHEGEVYETGWAVLPEFQGRGIATTATAQIVELLRAAGKHQYLYAYPSVDNAPSNAICRKLGFELTNVTEYEYPKDSGNIMRCNDWRLDLFTDAVRVNRGAKYPNLLCLPPRRSWSGEETRGGRNERPTHASGTRRRRCRCNCHRRCVRCGFVRTRGESGGADEGRRRDAGRARPPSG